MRKTITSAAIAVVLLSSLTAMAADPAVKCNSGKLKVASKYAACLLKADAKAVAKGEDADYTKCRDKFADTWAKAEEKAGPGICPGEGDAVAVQDFLDYCEETVAAEVSGATTALPVARVLKTGMTTCYAVISPYGPAPCAGTGQDGESQLGVAPSYSDNGDGTITDDGTGLMWEKLDNNNQPSFPTVYIHDWDRVFSWSQAFQKIADLNAQGFAGYTDWRLPNLKELFSIANLGVIGPSVDDAFNSAGPGGACEPGCTAVTCDWPDCATSICSCTNPSAADFYEYWSSSAVYQQNGPYVWSVQFFANSVVAKEAGTLGFVRAVRTAP